MRIERLRDGEVRPDAPAIHHESNGVFGFSWPRTSAVLGAMLGMLVLVLAAPALARRLLAKEGPVELASHVVLLTAVLTWLALAWRTGGADRLRAALMTGFLALVLAEELDWGGVLGLPAIGLRLDAAVGHRNLHNASHGASYLLFGLPLLLHFAAPARMHGGLAPVADERAACFAVALAFIAWNLGPWESHAQELLEGVLYSLLLAAGVRLMRARRDHGVARAGCSSTPTSARRTRPRA
ncbi:MAG TPA: hypothetical protein VGB85_14400 [Nannocystis sp.]